MEVKTARKRGFCFGVERAIELAGQVLRAGHSGTIYSLGEVIHNRQVVDRLSEQGLRVLERPEDAQVGDTVLIRSHGVPPQVIEQLKARGAEVVDATCVLVKRAQKIVEELAQEGYQVVVIGDEHHPEVQGVLGYAPGIICVDRPDQLDRLPERGRLGIVCQTTHSPESFGEMVGRIAAMGFTELKVINTLCLETRRRQESAVELAGQVDVMFVLGGMQSANTRQLAQLCRQAGVVTYHLEGWDQFNPCMVAHKAIAGVTAGASTPEWIIEQFVERLRQVEVEKGKKK